MEGKKSADPDVLIPFPILKTAYESLGSFFFGEEKSIDEISFLCNDLSGFLVLLDA